MAPTDGDPGSSDLGWSPDPPPRHATPAPEPVGLAGYSDFVAVARGGDSTVYRARQDGLNRHVAVKVLLLDDAATVARFRRELEITVRLGRAHPHIVSVLATATTTSGQPCLVMDYHDLGSLHDQLREHGPLPVNDVVTAGTVVADALGFAHTQGVLHRDVKPQNILRLPTSYVLADFGIARWVDAGHSASLERFSYRHAAPQVLDGEPPAVADDLYSLGSTLYTLLDGRPPFASDDPDADTALAYLRRVRTATPRPFTRTDVPAELAKIISRCLARDRADRYPDATTLRLALAAVPTEQKLWAPAGPVGTPADASAGTGESPASQSRPAPRPPMPRRPADSAEALPAGTAAVRRTGSPGTPGQPTQPVTGPVGTVGTVGAGALPGRTTGSTWDGVAPRTNVGPSAPAAPADPAAPAGAAAARPAPPERRPATPVATSALAHLDDATPRPRRTLGRVEDTEDTTGVGRPPPPAAADHTAADTAAAGRGGSRRRVLVFAAVALLVGSSLGVAGNLLRRGGEHSTGQSGQPNRTAAKVVPTFSGTLPSPTGPAQVDIGDPQLAPDIRGLEDHDTSVVLRWTDPSDGTATFVITRRPAVGGESLITVSPGITQTNVEGLDPAAPRYCFQVIAIVDSEHRGVSAERCTTRN